MNEKYRQQYTLKKYRKELSELFKNRHLLCNKAYDLKKELDELNIVIKNDYKKIRCRLKYILNSSGFSKREKDIIDLRFGITNDKRRGLEDVGRVFDITRERVRTIEIMILEKIGVKLNK